ALPQPIRHGAPLRPTAAGSMMSVTLSPRSVRRFPMYRLVGPVCVFLATVGLTLAQDAVRRGTIKKLATAKKTLVIASGGKDEEFTLTDDPRFAGVAGKDLAERLRSLKEGSDVFFKGTTRDGKSVLVGLKLAAADEKPAAAATKPKFDAAALK